MVTNISTESLSHIPTWLFLIGYFASAFFGMYLYNSSDQPLVSFVGYNLVVVPFSLVLNMFLAKYSQTAVIDAIQVTGIATAVMMTLGFMYPNFFKSIASGLFWGLLAAIVAELIMIFVMGVHLPIMNWIVAIIFCGYIGYDWARALEKPKTVDNAIDSGADLYIDIVNLFVRILSIMGNDD